MSLTITKNSINSISFTPFGPSLLLYADGDLASESLVNFTRPSVKQHFASDGLLKEAPTNTLPVSYDPSDNSRLGWLLEEARTNKIKNNTSLSANSETTVTETTLKGKTAFLIENTANGSTGVPSGGLKRLEFGFDSVPVSSGDIVTYSFLVEQVDSFTDFSVWLISNDLSIRLETRDINITDGSGTFTFDSGFTSTFIESRDLGNGSYRVWIGGEATTSGSIIRSDFAVVADAGKMIVGLGQIEKGSFPTSPIITEGSEVTRSADVADITDLSWYRQDEGTFVIEGRTANGGGTQTLFDVSDATDNERIYLQRNASNEMHLIITDGGATQANLNLGTVADDTDFKVAVAYKENDIAGVLDGGTAQTDNAATLPTVTQMNIGTDYNDGNHFNGYQKQNKYYSKRIADSQLQSLTS